MTDKQIEPKKNKETTRINCTYNVTDFKKFLKSKFTIINAQFALTPVAEILTIYLVDNTFKYLQKKPSKANMYEITMQELVSCIDNNIDLKMVYNNHIHMYCPTIDYSNTFCVKRKMVESLIESKCFCSGTSQLLISEDGYNYLMYLLSLSMNTIANAAFEIKEYSKKRNVDFKAILTAVKIVFYGELQKLMVHKLDNIVNLISHKVEHDVKDGEETDNKEDVEVEKKDNVGDDSSEESSEEDIVVVEEKE